MTTSLVDFGFVWILSTRREPYQGAGRRESSVPKHYFFHLRAAEVCDLRWDQVDFNGAVLHVRRGATMTVIGYARVSTTDQDLSIQEAALKAAGCQIIRAEKRSGTTTEGREALRTVLEFLHAGDVLMVTRIDRLARSIGDLQDIVRTVRARGAVLKATEQPIDTGTAAGKCFLDMLGVFAEFETNLRRERQLEGIAKAKAAGVYKGRPPSIEAARVRELKAQGMRPSDIAKALKIGRASVYRLLAQAS
jgi:DNA invertase Pin-like site-specific DNA recombinase